MLRTIKALMCAAFAMLIMLGTASVAGAQEVEGSDPLVDVVETITLDATLVLILVNFLLPVVNGIVLKANPKPIVAQILSALTSAVSGFVVAATQTDGTAIFTKQGLLFAAIAYLTQVATYLGVWKPHDVNSRTGPGFIG